MIIRFDRRTKQFLFQMLRKTDTTESEALMARTAKSNVYDIPQYSFVVKEWLAIIIAVSTFIFSLGGWYFKMGAYEKEMVEVKNNLESNYVRKDVLGATLLDMQRQLSDQSSVMQNMNIKMDNMTIAVTAIKAIK